MTTITELMPFPHNEAAERGVIGGVFASASAIAPVAPWLGADMFYSAQRGLIWQVMLDLFSRGEQPTIALVVQELRARDHLDRVGGIADVVELARTDYLSTQVESFARRVERSDVQRRLLRAATAIARIGADDSLDTEELIGRAQAQLAAIQMRGGSGGLRFLAELTNREYERLERSNSEGLTQGVRTGYRDIDDILMGLQDQDLIILAARPSVGKSALAMGMAYGVAVQSDRDALVFSLEMSRDQLFQRMISRHSRIDSMRIRSLRMGEQESSHYIDSLAHLSAIPLAIDETPAASLAHLRAECYRVQSERGRKLVVFVDYLQLMSAAGEGLDNRVQAVSAISRGLKALAKELDCPVVALSQLSRGVESRTSKIPLLSDLRESGSLEQDADVVMFIYREELYDKETDKKGIAELHIAKHRNGPIGVVPLRFDASTASFEDLTYRDAEGY